jgi:hypothetical protein
MKLHDLTPQEIDDIFDKAKNNFSNGKSASREKNFLCECVISAFLDHTAKMNYVIQNGKIFSDDDRKK